MRDHPESAEGNLANLVAVYILLQVVLIVFALVIGDAISILVGMLKLSVWSKLAILSGVCLLILCVLYLLRKRLLYHLSFEGISETVFPKKERERMLLLSKKWKTNSLSNEEREELQSMIERTFLPSDVVTVYSRKNLSLKELLNYLLAFLVGLPLLALLLKHMIWRSENSIEKNPSESPKQSSLLNIGETHEQAKEVNEQRAVEP